VDDIITLQPRRIIFNPGAEAREHYHQFPESIEMMEACNLVMLATDQY